MAATNLLIDAFGRIREVVHNVVDGLTEGQLSARLGDEANSIAWLVWHLTRIQDDHVAEASGMPQVWMAGWADRFGLPLDPADTGFGHSSEQVAAVRVASGALLRDYHDATYQQTVAYLRGLGDGDFARIVDRRWTPPVTLAVRLVSVISDDLQHAGQAAFVRGMLA